MRGVSRGLGGQGDALVLWEQVQPVRVSRAWEGERIPLVLEGIVTVRRAGGQVRPLVLCRSIQPFSVIRKFRRPRKLPYFIGSTILEYESEQKGLRKQGYLKAFRQQVLGYEE